MQMAAKPDVPQPRSAFTSHFGPWTEVVICRTTLRNSDKAQLPFLQHTAHVIVPHHHSCLKLNLHPDQSMNINVSGKGVGGTNTRWEKTMIIIHGRTVIARGASQSVQQIRIVAASSAEFDIALGGLSECVTALKILAQRR
jgi:hypothetical protein